MSQKANEYARQYYYANRERILEQQKRYQKKRREQLKAQKKLPAIVTETTAFDIRFQSMVQNITEMYNSLLKSHRDLQEAYTNMKGMLKKKDEHYQTIIDKLNKQLKEAEERKTKIRKFFNLQ